MGITLVNNRTSAMGLTLIEWAKRLDPKGETAGRLAEMVDEFERRERGAVEAQKLASYEGRAFWASLGREMSFPPVLKTED